MSLAGRASPTEPNPVVSQYLHDDFWGAEKGFPVDSVTSIAQTADGYLWIGTDQGLIRFDGLNFRRFEQANPRSFAIGPVRALLADAQGNLWILLQNTRLFRYYNGTFDLSRGEAENGITAMAVGTSGEILLSSVAVGPLVFDGKQFLAASAISPCATLAESGSAQPACDDRSARFSWSYGNMPDRLAAGTSTVISIAATADGKIWLGTQDRGLVYLREGRIYAPPNGLPGIKINCLLPLENAELWIGTSNGVLHWNGKELTPAGVPASLLHAQVLSMMRDRDSNIWVGTSTGILRFNAAGVSSIARPIPGTAGPVTALFEDREANLWVGSPRGIERLRRGAFLTYSGAGLQSASSGPVYADRDARIWFAPVSGGLHWLKDEKNGSVASDGLGEDVTYSITGGAKDLWIGRQRGGLTHLQFSDASVRTRTYTEADGLAQNDVYAVLETRDGTVWAGTLSGGVSRFDGHGFTTFTTTAGLASNTVTSILETRDGTVWFGTSAGLSSLSRGKWRTYARQDDLPSSDVNCLFEDSSGVLWTGTSNGLAYLSSGLLQLPSNLPALLRGQIFGIAEDKLGRFWIATADHVLAVQRNKIAAGTLAPADLREYTTDDGLLSTEGVKRNRSVALDPSGRIWFSLSRGLSVVDPSHVAETSAPAITHIEGLSVDGSPIDLRQLVRLPPSPKRIAFTYTGLSLAVPERVRFRYFLEGFDRGWSEPVATREAVYTNLGGGSYRFRVVASNSDGLWDGSETDLRFDIEPLFWQTWWFRIGSLAIILLSVWGAYRYRLHQLTTQFNIRVEERVSERTRIARDLHDTLLQSFNGLLLRFQAVSNLLPARPQDAKQRLEDAIDQAAQAITEGRDAVQGLRSSTTDTKDLAAALTALGEELAADKTGETFPVFDLQVEGEPQDLNPILRDEVYRIAGEALHNAFRHARAKRIEVEIHYDEHDLRVRIRDDGKGMDSQVLSDRGRIGHWGLHGMHERAKLVGGSLEVWSKLDSGTEIELKIPASTAYASPGTRRGPRFFGGGTRVKS